MTARSRGQPSFRVWLVLHRWPWCACPALAAVTPWPTCSGTGSTKRPGRAWSEGSEGVRAGEATLWRVRLATDPAEALDHAGERTGR